LVPGHAEFLDAVEALENYRDERTEENKRALARVFSSFKTLVARGGKYSKYTTEAEIFRGICDVMYSALHPSNTVNQSATIRFCDAVYLSRPRKSLNSHQARAEREEREFQDKVMDEIFDPYYEKWGNTRKVVA
jgi:hypothetical protein